MPLFTIWANRLVEVTAGRGTDPANIWIGLSTTVPGVDGSNWNEVPEAAYGGYARATLAGAMAAANGGYTTNNAVISFPTAQIGSAVVAAIGFFTDPVGGPDTNGRAFVVVQPALLIEAGRAPKFDPVTLTFSTF